MQNLEIIHSLDTNILSSHTEASTGNPNPTGQGVSDSVNASGYTPWKIIAELLHIVIYKLDLHRAHATGQKSQNLSENLRF